MYSIKEAGYANLHMKKGCLKRITSEKRLLRFSDKTIEQIGCEIGIADTNYFTRLFRKTEGITPCEYRKNGKATILFCGRLTIFCPPSENKYCHLIECHPLLMAERLQEIGVPRLVLHLSENGASADEGKLSADK